MVVITGTPKRRNIFARMEWKPDLNLLSRKQTEDYCSQPEPLASNGLASTASLGGLASLIDTLAHKDSSMQILEIGAGTGSNTNSILSILNRQGKAEGAAPRYSKYVFTDHSPRFFEQARARFAKNAERLSFQMLNLHHNPTDQGFQAGSFDLVIAVDFFRGEQDSASEALKNARALLKPDGYLALLETTGQEETILSGIWNTVYGWWSPKEAKEPSRSSNEWENNLIEAGYTGLEAAIPALGVDDNRSCLLAKNPGNGEPSQLPGSVSILVETTAQKKLADGISAYFKSNGLPTARIVSIDSMIKQNVETQADALLSLLEHGESFLLNLDEEKWAALKRVVKSTKRIYWVTSGAGAVPDVPENTLNNGFARCMIAENPGLLMCSIDFKETDDSNVSRNLAAILKATYGSSQGDWEYLFDVVKGVPRIPRATEANDINGYVFSQTGGFVTTIDEKEQERGYSLHKTLQNTSYSFDPNATYVIAGGLGGAGRSLAQYMSIRGAKHLILLSRSGAASDEAKQLVEELTNQGVNVATPKCDIGKREVVQEVLNECAKTMPPVKGAIQSTMVLSASPFQDMKLDQWKTVMSPKIAGTWNLYNCLPKLDFYVILSTLSGQTGTLRQCAYASSATFQDGFARHLWGQGVKCVSVDVGILNSVGYVAEHPEKIAHLHNLGHNLLEEAELRSVVDWACNPEVKIESSWDSQVITGLDRPGVMIRRGKNPVPYMSAPTFRHLREPERIIC